MDRLTNYFGQVPLETDLLQTNQNTMVALAKFCSGVLGLSTAVNGFTCTPTTPASLNVQLTPGEIYQLENLEATQWSSLPADTAHTIVKQGVLLNPVTLGITPPTAVGYSQVFLIEVQYEDLDAGAVVLPYFNAANPSQPFAGPGNAGSAQNTVRKGAVAYQVKAGTAAPTGTQVAPTPDAGWTALFTVTVANGATTITSGNITQLASAPFIPVTLPNVPNGVQTGAWIYAVDTGTANNLVATVWPPLTQLTPGTLCCIKVANQNSGASTLNLNGLGAVAIHRANSSALASGDLSAGMLAFFVYDGSAWQTVNFEGFTATTTNNNTYNISVPYTADTGTVNALVANFTPSITSLSAGLLIEVKAANTNLGPSTINVNSLGAVAVVQNNGQPLIASQITAGQVALLIYNGTAFELVNTGQFVLTQNGNLYVNTSIGSDTLYDGTSATVSGQHGPFATIQHAVYVASTYNLNGWNLTINVANGSYTGQVSLPQINGSGTISLVGNTANPSLCSVTATGSYASSFYLSGAGTYYIGGFRVSATGGGGNYGVGAESGVIIINCNMRFGPCGVAHIVSSDGALVWINSGTTMTIEAGASTAWHMWADTSGQILTNYPPTPTYPNLTILGAVSITAFALAEFGASIVMAYNTITGASYVTGQKYIVTMNGTMNTEGNGTGYLPGSAAGTISNGGQYPG